MKIHTTREQLLHCLTLIGGVVERRQTIPILSHVLLDAREDRLSLVGSDLEIEINVQIPVDIKKSGRTTVSARKFLDICRALPEEASVQIEQEEKRVVVRSGKSRFLLAALSVEDFPRTGEFKPLAQLELPQGELKKLLQGVHFAMALQDVRYYLNGLLIELEEEEIRMVATDGHRLAFSSGRSSIRLQTSQRVIVPRKAIIEMIRQLETNDSSAKIILSENHLQLQLEDTIFITKLIDGKFPDYSRVIPEAGENVLLADSEGLGKALTRISILSNEKYREVRLFLQENLLRIYANNPDQEEAEEEIAVEYSGKPLEIGFNVAYLLDAISAIEDEKVRIAFGDSEGSSILTNSAGDSSCKHVVMPIRL